MLMPPLTRREYTFNSKNTLLWPNGLYNRTVDSTLIDVDFGHHQSYRSIMIIDGIINLLSANVLYSTWNDQLLHQSSLLHEPYELPKIPFKYVDFPHECHNIDLARDSSHPGPKLHTALAERFWDSIKSDLDGT